MWALHPDIYPYRIFHPERVSLSRYLSLRNLIHTEILGYNWALFESWQEVRSAMTLEWCLRSQTVIHVLSLREIYWVLKTLTVTCKRERCLQHGKILGSELFYPPSISERWDKSCAWSKYIPKVCSLEKQDFLTSLNIVNEIGIDGLGIRIGF